MPRLGSPPHVWGKLVVRFSCSGIIRITPTCVGKANTFQRETILDKDHPHMCGESLPLLSRNEYAVGSPPHVWGKLPASWPLYPHMRITPTCVGKAKEASCTQRTAQDHPHMCGESTKRSQYWRHF